MQKKHKIRAFLFRINLFRNLWSIFKQHLLKSEYIYRREVYNQSSKSVYYSSDNIQKNILQKYKERNYQINKIPIGQVKSFFFLSNDSWHHELIDDLKIFGQVSCFDYYRHGFKSSDFHNNHNSSLTKRKKMNELFVKEFEKNHKLAPYDCLFIYANGYEILPSTINYLKKNYGIPTISICLDDKHSWEGKLIGDYRSGQIDIANLFDLNWTSSRLACDWYLNEGGNPILLPPGFNINIYKSNNLIKKDIPISFLGAPYGYRLKLIDDLIKYNIPIFTYGPGWNNKNNFKLSNFPKNNLEVIQRSQINLGCGNIGYSDEIINLKGRDFDIPGAGGFYLTSYNYELAEYFELNKEIVCYKNIIDLVEIIRFYLDHPEKCEQIGYNGMMKSLNSHRWYNRYEIIFKNLGIL